MTYKSTVQKYMQSPSRAAPISATMVLAGVVLMIPAALKAASIYLDEPPVDFALFYTAPMLFLYAVFGAACMASLLSKELRIVARVGLVVLAPMLASQVLDTPSFLYAMTIIVLIAAESVLIDVVCVRLHERMQPRTRATFASSALGLDDIFGELPNEAA